MINVIVTQAMQDAITSGKLRTLTRDESLEVGRAVDALLARRSEMFMRAPAALVLGELAVRIRCEPPYLPPHVSIRPRGALGKRVRHLKKRGLTPAEQKALCPFETSSGEVTYKGMASPSSHIRRYDDNELHTVR